MVFERIKQAFEGSQPCVQCGIPTEPGEELCPGCADPAIKVEMVVRLVSIRREAQARIDAGESLEAVAHGLLNDPSFEQLDPDASEDERVEQVRTQVAVQKFGANSWGSISPETTLRRRNCASHNSPYGGPT